MAGPSFLTTPQGRHIAYQRRPGRGPGLLFLGGFTSDMTGTKATHLEAWAAAEGRAFLRFDYSGHGASSGEFRDGCVSDWAEDARAVIDQLCEGPQVLVGSSMGGWIGLLLARDMPRQIAGFVGIAAAPDFTQAMLDNMSLEERDRLHDSGRGLTPDTGPSGVFEVWGKLIDDPASLVLAQPIPLPFPVRLLHGTADADVPMATALRLLERADGPDIRLTLVKDATHRFSTPECLRLIEVAAEEVLAATVART